MTAWAALDGALGLLLAAWVRVSLGMTLTTFAAATGMLALLRELPLGLLYLLTSELPWV